MVHNIQSSAEFHKLVKESSFVVIDCFATWCGPCKVIAPEIVKMAEAYPNGRFYKVDVDELPELAQELGVRAMPTFFFFKDGTKIGEVVGANKAAIEAIVTEHCRVS